MTLLSLHRVSKHFSGTTALSGVSFEVWKGEIVAIIGPSGSGKTTLLRLIDLLDYPSSGKIVFDGVDTEASETLRRSLRRRMGMVFQQPFLFNSSVFENVAYGLRVRGVKDDEIRKRVRDALEVVGLQELEKRMASTLSGGEAQRVAIARILVIDPELILLDEPTANLDPGNAGIIEGIVKRINEERGTTIVTATHNMFQAKRLGGMAVFLLNGEVVEIGDVEDVFDRPHDQRTAAFIRGEMVY